MLDPITTRNLAALNLPAGARCWEIGAGGGSIATWLATTVGDTGHVYATDIDTTHLTGSANLTVEEHDIAAEHWPQQGPFDLIHARLVLLHLPQRRRVLTRLAAVLAPGGRLLLEEFDCNQPLHVLTSTNQNDRDLFTRVHRAILSVLAARGASMTWAYEVPAAMAGAGLTDITTTAHADSAPADSLGALLQDVNVQQLRPALLDGGISGADLNAFRALMHDPTFTTMSYTLVTTAGRRPR
jgi:protein-L-isoaspartate O-methyltransferase